MTAFTHSNFFIEVAKGNVAGHSILHVDGHNEDFQAAEDIWDYGGDYTDSTAAVAHYISSSNAGDTEVIKVDYLDENWDQQTINVTLDGQNKTRIGTTETMIRIQGAKNAGSADLLGDVYIYEDDTLTAGVPDTATKVRGKMSIGHGALLNAKVAIPNGKVGFMVERTLTASISTSLDILLLAREFGKVYVVDRHPHLSLNSIVGPVLLPSIYRAKTDIKFRASASAANSLLGVSFSILLIDEDLVNS